MIYQIITLAILLIFSAFFSGVEIALFSLSNMKIRHLAENKVRGAETVKILKDDPHRLLITILIGNNLVNILAASLATSLAINFFQSNGVGIATGIMTFMVLVFGEIAPKAFATTHAESIALSVAKPLLLLRKVFYPFIFVLDIINKIIMRALGVKFKEQKITEDELKSIVRVSEEKGGIKKKERELIHNIFRFDDTAVNEIMTPRPDMFALEENMKVEDVVKPIMISGYSRVPVYSETIDKIVGMIYIKDFLKYLEKNRTHVKLKDFMKPVFFVPETKKIDTLLEEFRRRKMHIAVVVDEYGVVQGLVTIEDLLEQLVGEIYDETDVVEVEIKSISQKVAKVDGHTPLRKVNKKLGLDIKGTNEFETISGFILEKIGKIPNEGEQVDFGDFSVVIEKVEDNSIERVKIVKR